MGTQLDRLREQTRDDAPRRDERARIAQLEALAEDFRDAPEQIGHYLREARAAGRLTEGACRRAARWLERVHGADFATRALGAERGARAEGAPELVRAIVGEARGGELPYRAEMEGLFGASFAGVRAHLGRPELRRVGAEAAQLDEDVVFADGRPARGQVAHELAHVLQTRRAKAAAPLSRADDAAEREAHRVQEAVEQGRNVSVDNGASARVHLDTETGRTLSRLKPLKLKLFGATLRVPLRRDQGARTQLSIPLTARLGGLRLTRVEVELDDDFELKGGTVSGSWRLGGGLVLDRAKLRFDGRGHVSPTIEEARLSLGARLRLGVKGLTIGADGAVSGKFRAIINRRQTLLGGAVVLKPGFWLGVELHHNRLVGLSGGGARLRVDKLDLDIELGSFSFGRGGRSFSLGWLKRLFSWLRFPKIKIPKLRFGPRDRNRKSRVRFSFDDAFASLEDGVLTAGGVGRMWLGKRSIGVRVEVQASRGGVKVQVGPRIKLPRVKIPVTRRWKMWRPRGSELYPIIGGRRKKRGKRASAAVGLTVGAGFGLEVRPTWLEAYVKLTPPRLRGGVKLPGVELHLAKGPSKEEMFQASVRLRAKVYGRVGLAPFGSAGLKAGGDAFAALRVNPTLKAHLSSSEGIMSGQLSGRMRMSGELRAQLGVSLVLELLGMTRKEQLWRGGLRLRQPLGWTPSFHFDFNQLGPADIGDKPLVANEQYNSLARDFDEKARARQPRVPSATTELARIQRIIEVVATAVDILTPLHPAISAFKAGEVKAFLRAAKMAPEKLYKACMRFYDLVRQSERDGTLSWLGHLFPGGREVVAFLRGYMKAVDTTARGFAKAFTLIGRKDPFEEERKIRREHSEDTRAAIAATRIERQLLARGADPISARRIKYLTWATESPLKDTGTFELMQLGTMKTALEMKLPKAWGVKNRKRSELVTKGIPEPLAEEVARIYRLAFVNVTHDSWQYVQVAKAWERSATQVGWQMMAPTGDRRYFEGLVQGWLDVHQPQRINIEKGINPGD